MNSWIFMGDDRHGGVRDLSETTFRLSQSCCRPEVDQKRSDRWKILGIFFAPHFSCSTTGNFRAKLQFRKRFAIAKPCFALQFPLENTSVETVTTRELVRSVGRRRVRPSRCQSVPQVSSGQRTCNWTNYANTFCSMGADRWKVPGRGYSFLRAKSKYQPLN